MSQPLTGARKQYILFVVFLVGGGGASQLTDEKIYIRFNAYVILQIRVGLVIFGNIMVTMVI